MIAFVYGTTAELIKIAPVYHRLVEHGTRPLLWCTGQHITELPETARRLGLPAPDLELGRGRKGRNLARVVDVPPWAAGILLEVVRNRRKLVDQLWSDAHPPAVMVHGDTMTTVIGALVGRSLGVTVAHIEAGLRTNKLFEPFPEELDRRIAGRLAHVHYAPGIEKFGNLRRAGGVKVDTIANTVLDSVRSVPDTAVSAVPDIPEHFGLVSLHRFELIQNAERFRAVLERLGEWSEKHPMLVVTDAQTTSQLNLLRLNDLLDRPGIRRVGKLDYFDFVSLLRRASFVITDSGGLQEECAYLNIPCLVHRTTTERTEGLGTNVLLSMFDTDVLDRFLEDPDRYRATDPEELPSPSDIIVGHLIRAGHVGEPDRGPVEPTKDLTVLIPTGGDADTIRAALETLVRSLEATDLDYEVIVVSDGSKDNTIWEAEQVDAETVTVLHYSDNAGKGFAVKYGFAQTAGRVVVVADPVLLTQPKNIIQIVEELERSGVDVVAASKTAEGADVLMTPLRRLQTRLFSGLVTKLLDVPVSDAQLGLKAFRRPVLEAVLPYIRSSGFAFDIELLATAHQQGFTVTETPIEVPGRLRAIADPVWVVRTVIGSLRLAVLRLQLRVGRAPSRPGSSA